MALLFILLALFAFVGFGSGSPTVGHVTQSSSSSGSATATGSTSSTVTESSVQTNGTTKTTCIVVTWKLGQPAHKRPCRKAPAKP